MYMNLKTAHCTITARFSDKEEENIRANKNPVSKALSIAKANYDHQAGTDIGTLLPHGTPDQPVVLHGL